MGKILVIAEKPSVAADIGRVLGCRQKGEGFIESEKYIVSWAVGHLVTLWDPEDYNTSLKKWSADTLPIMPKDMGLKAIKGTSKQLSVLKKLMNAKTTDYIICATDSGREGELIFRYIYTFVKCKKPFKRLWISSMTDEAIKDGMASLKDGCQYDNLFFSAQCRSQADWLVGINASRAYTVKYGALLSIGRVQTPTLNMIVKRQNEIENFVSQDYYEVAADYGNFKGLWFKEKYSDTKIDDIKTAWEIKNKVQGQKGLISDVKREEKKENHPLLYDLTELQRTANRYFGFSAKKTLDIAQSLYEKRKLITYPRTDSRYLSEDMRSKAASTLGRLKAAGEYGPLVEKLNLNSLNFTKRIIDNSRVTDHHAIIPTDKAVKLSGLSEDELKIYGLIARRFICVFYPPYKYAETTAVVVCKGESFVSKGKKVISLGWKEAELLREKNDKAAPPLPPDIKKGDYVNVLKCEVVKKATQPPKQYTEATLLSAMENAGRELDDEDLKETMKDSGIGTPATRAAIIERLLQVGYISRKGKSLAPSQKGINLCAAVPEELKSAATTGRWERGLNLIAGGKMEKEKFMASIGRFVVFIVNSAAQSGNEVEFEKEEPAKKRRSRLGICPLCGKGGIYENSKAFYCNNYKTGCNFTVWKDALNRYGAIMDSAKMRKLLKDGIVKNVKITMPQTGEQGKGNLILNKNRNFMLEIAGFERDEKAKPRKAKDNAVNQGEVK